MIDDIRVKVTVNAGRAAQKDKNGDTQQSLADFAVSDKCLSHVAKSYVPIDRCVVATQMLNWWCGSAYLSIAHLVLLSCDASEPSGTSAAEADDQVIACAWIASCRAIPDIALVDVSTRFTVAVGTVSKPECDVAR